MMASNSQASLDGQLIDILSLHNLPFSLLDSSEFKRFIHKTNPKYKLFCGKNLRNNYLENYSMNITKQLSLYINNHCPY